MYMYIDQSKGIVESVVQSQLTEILESPFEAEYWKSEAASDKRCITYIVHHCRSIISPLIQNQLFYSMARQGGRLWLGQLLLSEQEGESNDDNDLAE
jgi:hypothetical protein